MIDKNCPIIDVTKNGMKKVTTYLTERGILSAETGDLMFKPSIAVPVANFCPTDDVAYFIDIENECIEMHMNGKIVRSTRRSQIDKEHLESPYFQLNKRLSFMKENMRILELMGEINVNFKESIAQILEELQYRNYLIIMAFMEHGKEYIEEGSVRKVSLEKSKNRSSKSKSKKVQVVKLVKRITLKDGKYEPKNVAQSKSRKPIENEFSVRGHYRNYKSGKRVWVDSFKKCKGKEPKQTTYKV